jgi:hypothetical protein
MAYTTPVKLHLYSSLSCRRPMQDTSYLKIEGFFLPVSLRNFSAPNVKLRPRSVRNVGLQRHVMAALPVAREARLPDAKYKTEPPIPGNHSPVKAPIQPGPSNLPAGRSPRPLTGCGALAERAEADPARAWHQGARSDPLPTTCQPLYGPSRAGAAHCRAGTTWTGQRVSTNALELADIGTRRSTNLFTKKALSARKTCLKTNRP